MKIACTNKGAINAHYYEVANDYDFAVNGATDESLYANGGITNWDQYGELIGSTPQVIRDEIDTLVAAQIFISCTSAEKTVASKWFVVDKSDRDSIDSAAVQEANAEILATLFCSDVEVQHEAGYRDRIKDSDKAVVDAELETVPTEYNCLWIPAGAFAPRTTNGAAAQTEEYATNDIMLDQYLFDGITEEGIQTQLSMPEEWDLGDIKVKAYWDAATGASASDQVSWGIKGGSLKNDEAIDAALGTQQVVDDVVLAVGVLHISPASPAITIAGTPAKDDLIIIQVVRNVGGNDNMTEDAKFIGMKIQYGKTEIATKWPRI